MLSMMDVVKLLKTDFPDWNVFPLEYPLDSEVEAVLVDMTGNTPAMSGVFNLNVQFKVRSSHPTTGEANSYLIRNILEKKTNFTLGDLQVIMVTSQNPVPLYMGKDNDDSYLYSNNFIFKMNEGGQQ